MVNRIRAHKTADFYCLLKNTSLFANKSQCGIQRFQFKELRQILEKDSDHSVPESERSDSGEAKSEPEDAGLPQSRGRFKGIKHSRTNQYENSACDWRSSPKLRINRNDQNDRLFLEHSQDRLD